MSNRKFFLKSLILSNNNKKKKGRKIYTHTLLVGKQASATILENNIDPS
jgi:hypothetical protein